MSGEGANLSAVHAPRGLGHGGKLGGERFGRNEYDNDIRDFHPARHDATCASTSSADERRAQDL
eukprot:17048-Prymnesium_polylepis.2